MSDGNRLKFQSTFEYKLIYIFRINDEVHRGCLKIGDATVHTDKNWKELPNNCHDLNSSAHKRIDEYTSTAGINYELLHAEIAVYVDHCNGKLQSFRDHKVHDVLIRSGIKRKFFDTQKKQNEWFVTDLETAKKAIKAVKDGKSALDSSAITKGNDPIIFRPEQEQAIKETLKRFKTGTKMLWNAKMRFGKTLCALQVAKDKGFKATIILTHRPVVSDGWYEDFGKIFYDKPEYEFASKTKGKPISELVNEGKSFVYFASIQDLRGASAVGGKFNKDDEIYSHDWDFVVVDEAHEGTQTELGQKVIEQIISSKNKPAKVLELSGTPFNLLNQYESDDIYTWDYIMEQEAKRDFALHHFGDSNPYEDLPKLNIYTYHLEKTFAGYQDLEDKAFNFREFFRIWTGNNEKDQKPIPEGAKIGDFVHEDEIVKFLNLISQKSETTNYPFSTEEYRKLFKNTLWVVPGVKEAKALSVLLQKHSIFGMFKIVNVAGDGDEEIDSSDALTAVRNAFKESEYTITLSCGRLTTGVSVKEWTAVLMLAGSYSTSASQYLQTIFRVQTPANIDGKTKENCYVFDFAPDRTLKMVAESVQLSAKAGKKEVKAELALKKFLNFCPVISIDDTRMKEFKVDQLLQALKKAYIERVAKNGFDDNKLYNDELLKLDGIALEDFQKLKQIIGASNQQKKAGDIDINNEGFTDEEYEAEENAREKKKRHEPLTEEEERKLKELKEKKKNRDTAISILRGISIRIPLLVYGIDMDINSDITIDTFSDPKIIDDLSWNEFMPKGVTREMFRKFSKYYDKDIFIGACRRIRTVSKNADSLEPTERVERIAELFSTFKNPDKETVLTPWRVVNLHLGQTLGGYSFYDDKFENTISEPRFIDKEGITSRVFNEDSNILEINSKTGLYPLYVSYTLYRLKLNKIPEDQQTFEVKQKLWNQAVQNQVFVICKTPMAKQITKRTLVGYQDIKVNARYFEDLINQLKDKRKCESFIKKVHQGKSYWNRKEDDNMKFNAVVGNPPYQSENTGDGKGKDPIYHYFIDAAMQVGEIGTLIHPARFLFKAGKTPKEWDEKMLHDKHFKVINYYPESKDIFPTESIKGGIAITYWDKSSDFGEIGTFNSHFEMNSIVSKVRQITSTYMTTIVYPRDLYRLTAEFYKENPSCQNRQAEGHEFDVGSNIGDLFPEIFTKTSNEKDVARIYTKTREGRKLLFVKKKYLKLPDNFDFYKVFFAKLYGVGAFGEAPQTPIVGAPGDGSSATFLSIGKFETEQEAENVIKYSKTKFVRSLISTLKVTPNSTKDTWANVPIQNFTSQSDIDWSKSIDEIDKQLYKKYQLNDEEIEFIEKNVKPMK